MYDEKIRRLSVDEYFYLTENLEIADKRTIEKGIGFLVQSRRQKIVDVIRQVIENELNDYERIVVKEHLSNGLSAEEVQKKYRIPHTSFYRHLNRAQTKLKNSLKYVLLYEKISIPYSAEDLIKYVKSAEQ